MITLLIGLGGMEDSILHVRRATTACRRPVARVGWSLCLAVPLTYP